MAKLLGPLNKVMGAMGLVDDDDDDNYENEENFNKEEEVDDAPEIINKKGKLVSIKSNVSARVVLKRPSEFTDIMEIVDSVKSRKIVVMNMTEVESKLAQRMIDYIVGACYALNGSFQEIARSIYIFAPDNVDINNELKQEMSKSEFFSFDR